MVVTANRLQMNKVAHEVMSGGMNNQLRMKEFHESDDALIREQPVTGIGDHAKGFAER
jgi:hypothetical protein